MNSISTQQQRVASREVNNGMWLVSFHRSQDVQPVALTIDGAVPMTVTRLGPALYLYRHPEEQLLSCAEVASHAVIFDGLLYNKEVLSQQLELTDAENDAAVILHAYLRWGADFAAHIKGIFTFIIWGESTETLLCGRDAIGIYPLFYGETDQELLFSTTIKTLHRHPRLPKLVNRALLTDHLRHRWNRPEETFFAHISRVQPASIVKFKGNERTQFRYWDPAPVGEPVKWIEEDELEQFDVLLDQAVERYLSIGPAAIYLSGGLDSVTIAAATAEISRHKGLPTPLALSLIFPDPECNEENVQSSVADGLGLPKYLVPFFEALGSRGLLRSALDLSSSLSVPLLNTWLPAYCHLATEGRRQGRQVIMTGNGGDEWLTVTPLYAADLVRSFDVRGLYALWRSTQRSYHASQLNILRSIFWTFGMRPVLRETVRGTVRRAVPGMVTARQQRRRRSAFMRAPAWFAPDAGLRSELIQRVEEEQPTPLPQSFYLREMRPALDHPLITWDMEEVFEVGQQLGVRVLHPFWDAELVDLLFRTPPPLLNRNGRSKGLVRQSLARRFPDLGFEQQKKVTSTNFFRTLMLQEGGETWQAMGGAQALADLGIVDGQLLNETIQSIVSGKNMPEAYRIWDVLNLESWLRANA